MGEIVQSILLIDGDEGWMLCFYGVVFFLPSQKFSLRSRDADSGWIYPTSHPSKLRIRTTPRAVGEEERIDGRMDGDSSAMWWCPYQNIYFFQMCLHCVLMLLFVVIMCHVPRYASLLVLLLDLDIQSSHDLPVLLRILLPQVLHHPLASVHQNLQSSRSVLVLLVHLHVTGEVLDLLGHHGDLHGR